MKFIAKTVTAIIAAVASIFVAAPAFAEEPHVGISQYSTAGGPADIVAITIVMVVLLVVILALSTWVGNLFEKKN